MPVVMATPARRRRTNVQRWRACWRRYAANSASVCVGLTGGWGGSITPTRVSARHRHPRCQPLDRPARHGEERASGATTGPRIARSPTAAGTPDPPISGPGVRGARVDGENDRPNRTPRALGSAARRWGRGPPPTVRLPKPAGSLLNAPRHVALHRRTTLPSAIAQRVDGRPAQGPTAACARIFTLVFAFTMDARTVSGRLRVSVGYSARLHQRPSLLPTVTAMSKQVDTSAEVMTSSRGTGGHEPPLANEAGMREAAVGSPRSGG